MEFDEVDERDRRIEAWIDASPSIGLSGVAAQCLPRIFGYLIFFLFRRGDAEIQRCEIQFMPGVLGSLLLLYSVESSKGREGGRYDIC